VKTYLTESSSSCISTATLLGSASSQGAKILRQWDASMLRIPGLAHYSHYSSDGAGEAAGIRDSRTARAKIMA